MKHRTALVTLVLLSLLAAACGAPGGEDAEDPAPAFEPSQLSIEAAPAGRLRLTVRNTRADEVLAELRRVAGVSLIMVEPPPQAISLQLTDVSVAQAFARVAEASGLVSTEVAPGVFQLELAPPKLSRRVDGSYQAAGVDYRIRTLHPDDPVAADLRQLFHLEGVQPVHTPGVREKVQERYRRDLRGVRAVVDVSRRAVFGAEVPVLPNQIGAGDVRLFLVEEGPLVAEVVTVARTAPELRLLFLIYRLHPGTFTVEELTVFLGPPR